MAIAAIFSPPVGKKFVLLQNLFLIERLHFWTAHTQRLLKSQKQYKIELQAATEAATAFHGQKLK